MIKLSLHKKDLIETKKITVYDEFDIPREHGSESEIIVWKFKDENGNLWVTETAIDGTEDEAKQIILQSLESE